MRRQEWLIVVMALLVLGVSPCAGADVEEFSFFGGALRGANDSTFVVQMEYLRKMGWKPFAFSIATIDEGHLDAPGDKHHRDGFMGQAWAYYECSSKLSLWGGIGPYLYYDTQSPQYGRSVYETGFAMVASADVKYRVTEHWFVRMRANAIEGNIGTRSILLGVGRDLSPRTNGAVKFVQDPKNEISLISGPHGNGIVEYRRSLAEYVEASGAYYDGKKATGVAAELWLVNRVLGDRLKIGIGAGPYYDLLHDGHDWSGIVTAMARYAIHPRWDVIVQWDRVHTRKGGDVDINSAGIGFKF